MKEYPKVSIVIPTYNRKEKLSRLIKSIKKSNYPKNKLEIIVIEDNCNDDTFEYIHNTFKDVIIIRNKKSLYSSACKNVGINKSTGKYILLIDDDNVVSKTCIPYLVRLMEHDKSIGIAGPIMYYLGQPKRIWSAGAKRNMLTTLTTHIFSNVIDNGQIPELIEVEDFPNAFMASRELIKKIKGFDLKLFPHHYSEADFGIRARREKFKIICDTKAKDWHDMPLPEEVKDKSRLLHCDTSYKAWDCAKSRIDFHRKYSSKLEFLVYLLILNWGVGGVYLYKIISSSNKPLNDRFNIAKSYIKGTFDGILERG